MKTKEFIKKVEEIVDVFVEEDFQSSIQQNLRLYDKHNRTIATIDLGNEFMINTDTFSFDNLFDDKEKLFNLIVEYASTPINEREEEKKYYLKHRWLRCLGGCALLHESTKFHTFVLMGGFGEVPKDYKMKFTQKEIDEIKEKYNTDLSDFERVEVKE